MIRFLTSICTHYYSIYIILNEPPQAPLGSQSQAAYIIESYKVVKINQNNLISFTNCYQHNTVANSHTTTTATTTKHAEMDDLWPKS